MAPAACIRQWCKIQPLLHGRHSGAVNTSLAVASVRPHLVLPAAGPLPDSSAVLMPACPPRKDVLQVHRFLDRFVEPFGHGL